MASTILSDNGVSSGSAGLKTTADSTGALALQTSTSGGAATTAVTIDTSQNVGIGTTSPTGKLHVSAPASTQYGTFDAVTATSAFTNYKVGGTVYGYLGDASGLVTGGTAGDLAVRFSGAMVFSGGANERMRITSGGIVGVATTTPDTAFQMTVASTGFATTRVNFGSSAGFVDGSTIYCGSDGVNPTSWVDNAGYRFGSSRQGCVVAINPSGYTYEGGSGTGTRTFAVNSNGNVQNTNNSYGSLSDAKLKENIVDASPKLNDLMRVKIRNFNLIADEAKTKQIGVVAQELEEIFPSMIDEHTDYTFEEYVKEDGSKDSRGIPTGTVTKEVKYSVFVPMLIKAIQELKAINDTQAETINALTARIVALEQA